MFGLFKKQVTPTEFGEAIVYLAKDFLASDGGRSLGTQFDNWDGSDGWGKFLERRGMLIPLQRVHFILFTHCSVQAACTDLEESKRRQITQGATSSALQVKPDGYDFVSTYTTLEAVYRGGYMFSRDIEALSNSDIQFDYLPNPNVGVLNAKFLIDNFVIPNMDNSNNFISGFHLYSGTVCTGISVVRRAMVHLSKSVKI